MKKRILLLLLLITSIVGSAKNEKILLIEITSLMLLISKVTHVFTPEKGNNFGKRYLELHTDGVSNLNASK